MTPRTAPAATPTLAQDSTNRSTGVYVVRNDGTREILAANVIARLEQEGGGLFERPRSFAVVNGVRASTRSTQHYQVFEFVFPEGDAIIGQVTRPNQFALVQMYEEEEYDERTLDIVSGGLDPNVVISFSTEEIGSGRYRVTPTEPLGLGEFCFLMLETVASIRAGVTVFDFGVDPG